MIPKKCILAICCFFATAALLTGCFEKVPVPSEENFVVPEVTLDRMEVAHYWGWWYFNDPQVFDDRISWSVDWLPAGTYELTYQFVPVLPGEYRVMPARAYQNYFPEVQGNSTGDVFEITD